MVKGLILLVVVFATSAYAGISDIASPPPEGPSPHRPRYHITRLKSEMNDPNGLAYYKGYYHLQYQSDYGATGWGHAVSTDLVNWTPMDNSLLPDEWYDGRNVASGSMTVLRDGTPLITYAAFAKPDGDSRMAVAVPADPSDPLLRRWTKPRGNPVVRTPPPGTSLQDFRDPTSVWSHPDGRYRVAVGARLNGVGAAHLYAFSPSDVHSDTPPQWSYLHPLHTAERMSDERLQGMWECPDFFSLPIGGPKPSFLRGTSGPGEDRRLFVFKASSDGHDWYQLGAYDPESDKFVPSAGRDAKTLWLDGGMFYASKSFYDPKQGRQILVGWVQESLSNRDPKAYPWDGLQSFPRELSIESLTGYLLQSPVAELESLRDTHTSIQASLTPNSIVPVIGPAQLPDRPNQYELTVEFSWPSYHALWSLPEFGVRIAEDPASGEVTVVRAKATDGAFTIAIDRAHSSSNPDADSSSLVTTVRVEREETSVRLQVLVDRSVVEVFGARGRGVVTGRVYPTSPLAFQASVFVGEARLGMRELSARIDLWTLRDASVVVQ